MKTKALETIIDRFKKGQNLFITGQAGVGKTYLLNSFLDWLEEGKYHYGLAGSTGVAAINIGGTTLHRMFGINRANSIEEFEKLIKFEPYIKVNHKRKMKELINCDVIIIDEISMVGSKLLELLDYVLRKACKNNKAFGGKQVVFSGDFLQLPPVRDSYAFESLVWKEMKFVMIHLTQVHRQSDKHFIDILTKLRVGECDDEVWEFINERITDEEVDLSATKLYSKNISVDLENETMLDSIDGEERVYVAKTSGNTSDIDLLKKNINAIEHMKLKKGVKVMTLANSEDLTYVNGSVGVVTKLSDSYVIVKFENGIEEVIEPWTWNILNNEGEETASYTQLPLRLAYAITIHKSQGMSIDGELFIDCKGISSPGQFYVAISRVRDWKKLKIVNFDQKYIKTNLKAKSFYK